MKITKYTIGWHCKEATPIHSVPSALIIVDFQNDGDPATYSAFVVLHRKTGKVRLPTYFRNVAASAVSGPKGEVSGEALQFPVETRLELEDAALEFAIEKGLVNANRSS